MEVILSDYKTYIFVFLIAFVLAFYEVLREAKVKERAREVTQKLLGRIVFFKDKVKSYSSSSSSSSSD